MYHAVVSSAHRGFPIPRQSYIAAHNNRPCPPQRTSVAQGGPSFPTGYREGFPASPGQGRAIDVTEPRPLNSQCSTKWPSHTTCYSQAILSWPHPPQPTSVAQSGLGHTTRYSQAILSWPRPPQPTSVAQSGLGHTASLPDRVNAKLQVVNVVQGVKHPEVVSKHRGGESVSCA